MKIISRNVNGIRAAHKKGLMHFLQGENPDVFCVQETKAFLNQMPAEIRVLPFQTICRHAGQRPGYAGTAILTQPRPQSHTSVFDHSVKFHEDGRVTQAEYDDFILLNIYFPNGGTRADGTEMLSYKLGFYDDLTSYVQSLDKPTIIVGDFNICHQTIDIARPEANKNSIGFLPVERQRIGDFMQECQMKDMFRHLNPEQTDAYTWWSYRGGARQRNVGRRLDYAMVHDSLLDRVASFRHLPEVMGSDHCPIELVMK